MIEKTYHIITFGCQMNVHDSHWLGRALNARGFFEAPLEDAQVVVVNTCSVREKPEQKVMSTLGRIRQVTGGNPAVLVCVAGCVAQQLGESIFEKESQVRLVAGSDGIGNAPQAIERLLENPAQRLSLLDFTSQYVEREATTEPGVVNGAVAYANIMQGCDNFCAYCIVPFTRGRQKSRSSTAIIDECKALIDNGAREITLLGQNVNAFGQDKSGDGTSFAALLRKVASLPGLERLRYVTPHPKDMGPEDIAAFAELPQLCPRLHLPMQAGSDAVLARMKRRYDSAGFLDLVERLRAAIARLNPQLTTAAREDALQQVRDLGIPALLSANRRFHQLLVTGVPVEVQRGGETLGDFARLIDWVDPSNNEWLAINQFTVKGPHHTRRPDIVLFVNGLPLVVIELKNPADANADIWKAFEQLQTYKAQTPDLFQYNEVLVISDGSDARMGSLSADAERFMQWRTIDGIALDPLGEFNELETLIRGVLAPALLLDYLRYFVLFEDDGGLVKKIAGYHQFHAVRAAIQQVIAASRPGGAAATKGKGGVVWHTQGSGKSITMTCFAARVMQATAMENPTIVVITDRNDLDGQLFGVFSLAQDLLREQPVQAHTRQDLRARLANRPSGGIVFATIQKFMPGEDEDAFPLLSDRSNIVVIADEAHRTQYGFEAKLKQRIQERLANASGARFSSGEVSWKRSKDSASLDTAQLLKDHPEMAQTYQITKPGSRRFLVQP